MTQIDIQEVRNKLRPYITKYSEDKSNSEIARLFLNENPDVPLTVRSIRGYVALIKEAESSLMEDTDEIGPEIDDELDSNEIVTEWKQSADFEITYQGTSFYLTRNTVDLVLCAYSRRGLNLTAGLIQRVLDLAPVVIKAIIYKLGVTKESDPYSALSAERLTADELYAELDQNVTYLLSKLADNDGTVTSTLNKEYKKTVLLNQHQDLRFKSLIEDLKDSLPEIKIQPMTPDDDDNFFETDTHNHIIIPDMHIGLVQSNYNYDIIKEQLKRILVRVQHTPNAHLYFMGDIIHSVSGLNHKDTWKNMDPKGTGAEAIIQPYLLLSEFISGIKHLKSVNIVGGNHDRLQSDKSQENTGEGAKLVAFMLSEGLKFSGVKVTYDPNKIVNNDDPKMTMIVLHGDKPIDKAPGQEIAWNLGDPKKFNYIVTAHTHARKQEPRNDGLTFRKETLSAFCPSDDYAKTVAHGSLPGYKIVTAIYESGLPLVIDIPLQYDKI